MLKIAEQVVAQSITVADICRTIELSQPIEPPLEKALRRYAD